MHEISKLLIEWVKNYSLWFELITLIVLILTLYWLRKYTIETEKMKNEMVKQNNENIRQHKLSLAHDISFTMIGYYILQQHRSNVIGSLNVTERNHNINDFVFFDNSGDKIGQHGPFQKVLRSDNFYICNYYMNEDNRKKILHTLRIQNGIIKAKVSLTIGYEYIYTFKTKDNNWKEVGPENPNLSDEFILIKKEIYIK